MGEGGREGGGAGEKEKKARKGNEAKANQFLQSRKQGKLVAFLFSSLGRLTVISFENKIWQEWQRRNSDSKGKERKQ